MKVQVLMLEQDDPKKCTAAKLVKFGLVDRTKNISKKTIVLDPFSPNYLFSSDKNLANVISAIDCSWNHAQSTFLKKFSHLPRKLPPLLAGNPVNYSKINKLTTVEALSGALFILGFKEKSRELLDKFKWGHTFFELNQYLLDDYSKVQSRDEIDSIIAEYSLPSPEIF